MNIIYDIVTYHCTLMPGGHPHQRRAPRGVGQETGAHLFEQLLCVCIHIYIYIYILHMCVYIYIYILIYIYIYYV